jgi:hypothetical protein
MSENLQDLITKTLGVVPTAPISAPKAPVKHYGIPDRPTPRYEYRVSVSRTEYGTAYVTAASDDDVYDAVYEVDWIDSGDESYDDYELVDDEPVNLGALEEWDSQYGHKYDHDSDPKCTNCEDNYPLSSLHVDPDDARESWYCASCCEELDILPSSN